MKIKPEHFDAMKKAMNDNVENIPTNKTEYLELGFTAKRYQWDLLRITKINGVYGIKWICENLYSYLNDDHIDTALRAITAKH